MPVVSLHTRCVHRHGSCHVLAHASPYYNKDCENKNINMIAIILSEVLFTMSVNCLSVDGTPTAGRSVADLHPRQRADDGNRQRTATLRIVGPLAAR